MPPSPIDASAARALYSVLPDASEGPLIISREARRRTLSVSSTASTLSLATPAPSSGNPSSSSLNLPDEKDADQTPSTSGFSNTANEEDVYVDQVSPVDEYVLALHDFVPQQQAATCLFFRAGETIRVLNRDPSGWWDGELDGRRGWFPSNYVDRESSTMVDEPLQPVQPQRMHIRSPSEISFASRASTVGPMPTQRASPDAGSRDLLFPSETSDMPSLMIPLLHALQLLQNTILSRRVNHYNPSVACIIQCIRSLLQQTDCLARNAPLLRAFPPLAQERKHVLEDLALLVTQSKKSTSTEYEREEERGEDEEHMLRLAGQVFSRVRRFLAVAIQCGIEIPERTFSSPPIEAESEVAARENGANDNNKVGSAESHINLNAEDEVYYPVTGLHRASDHEVSEGSNRSSTDSATPLIGGHITHAPRLATGTPGHVVHHRYRGQHASLSISSSFSSFSSGDSMMLSSAVHFPEGPCSARQVEQALRATHDSLLSTIAAFIGHVHAHSRAAHASSIGNLFALVRQIVDIVCRLLTIVDAIMSVEGIPWMKQSALENAKENLYQMACALADAVREMASSARMPTSDEEEERRRLLKVATDVLRAGSDCVSAVKTCLARPLNAPPYVIILPPLNETSGPADGQAQITHSSHDSAKLKESCPRVDQNQVNRNLKSQSLSIDEDKPQETPDESHDSHITYAPSKCGYESESATIPSHLEKRTIVNSSEIAYLYKKEETSITPRAISEAGRQSFDAASLNVAAANSTAEKVIEEEENTEAEETERDLPSPTIHSVHDPMKGQLVSGNSLEDKLINGELPSIPHGEDEIPLSWTLSHDYAPQDVAYNSDGQLVGATLEALVEKMTLHDQILDPTFSAVFFLTFRLFTTPSALAEAIISRFSLTVPFGLSEADVSAWQQQKLLPVRLRVSNFLKLWLEAYWRSGSDEEALPILQPFVRGAMSEILPAAAQRIDDLIVSRQAPSILSSPVSERQRLGERLRDAGTPLSIQVMSTAVSEAARPIMTKTLLASLRARNFSSISVTDFDALELARQLTLIESVPYCSITAEEMLETGRPGAPPAVNVKAVTTLSTAITGWVSESILGEADLKRRIALVKFFIKLADRCATLNNFSTPRSILAALDSSTISRLHQTWAGLPQKSKVLLEALRKLSDHARNYHEYRTRLRNTAPPAIPFFGLYLTDLTFCREGNPSHRSSPLAPEKKLINFNKYQKLARIVQDMQRFQVPYNLKDVPEAQQYIHFCLDKVKDLSDLEDLYRRSRLLEPKQLSETPTSATSGEPRTTLFGWGSRSQASSQASQATSA